MLDLITYISDLTFKTIFPFKLYDFIVEPILSRVILVGILDFDTVALIFFANI